jgi:site-specific DNA-methyltransferase (adenine-specific)
MNSLINDDVKVDAIITDPPYGTTACKWDSVIPFYEMWERLNKLIKSNGAIVLFGLEPFSSALRMSNIKNYKYDWYWNKISATGFLNAKKMPLKNIENISIFQKSINYNPQMRAGFKAYKISRRATKSENYSKCKKKSTTISDGTRYPVTLLEFSKDTQKLNLHPTQKPVALMEYLIKTYTNKGDTVLDFTMGSGTTGVACKNLNRDFIGIELDEKYFEIAKARINEK